MRKPRAVGGWICAVALAAALVGASPRAHAVGGADVWLLTMAPGFDLFSRFGHNALLVRERGSGRAIVYNFGTFDAGDPALLSKYLARKLDYFVSTSSYERTAELYRGRTITAQHLDLPAASNDRLVERLRFLALPENAAYRYDHIRDNCSTRLRDLLDEATSGALRERFARTRSGSTIRQALDHILGNVPFERFGVSYILGGAIDEPATRWELQFLPRHLRDDLGEVRVLHPDGVSRPLVDAERKILEGAEEPTRIEREALIGLSALFLLPFLLAVVFGGGRRSFRALVGVWLAVWGLLAGIGGALLVFLWIVGFSAGQANGNLLFTNPLHIVFLPLGILYALGKLGTRGVKVLRALLWIVLAVAAGDLLAHTVGFAHQSHLGLGAVSAMLPALVLFALRERFDPLRLEMEDARRVVPVANAPVPVAAVPVAAVPVVAVPVAAVPVAAVPVVAVPVVAVPVVAVPSPTPAAAIAVAAAEEVDRDEEPTQLSTSPIPASAPDPTPAFSARDTIRDALPPPAADPQAAVVASSPPLEVGVHHDPPPLPVDEPPPARDALVGDSTVELDSLSADEVFASRDDGYGDSSVLPAPLDLSHPALPAPLDLAHPALPAPVSGSGSTLASGLFVSPPISIDPLLAAHPPRPLGAPGGLASFGLEVALPPDRPPLGGEGDAADLEPEAEISDADVEDVRPILGYSDAPAGAPTQPPPGGIAGELPEAAPRLPLRNPNSSAPVTFASLPMPASPPSASPEDSSGDPRTRKPEPR